MAVDVACRRKRDLYSLYLDDPHALLSPSSNCNPSPFSKRIRFSSSPPLQGSTGRSGDLCRLEAQFPDLERQACEGVLEACGNNLNSATTRLVEIQSASAERNNGSPVVAEANITESLECNSTLTENFPTDGAGWVEILISEMKNASDMEDAKARASRVLEFLKKSIVDRAGAEAMNTNEEENKVLNEHVAKLLHDNSILKRAVVIQHEHKKDSDEKKGVELQQLKQMVSQYQERIRTLEISNYALAMHLRQAQQSSMILGRHPDVF